MKATITIYLDNGTKVELSLDEALELRDKLNKLAPKQEKKRWPDSDEWMKEMQKHFRSEPKPWNPEPIFQPGKPLVPMCDSKSSGYDPGLAILRPDKIGV